MLSRVIPGFIIGFVLVCDRAPGEDYTQLPTNNKATNMAITEDGQLLVVAHEDNDVISVWSVTDNKHVATIECSNPRFLLCRGKNVFVANYDDGTISIISRDDWKITKTIELETKKVYYLSAPQGKYFQGKLLAQVYGEKHDGDYHAMVVDVASGASQEARAQRPVYCTVDYTGEKYIAQARFGSSSSGVINGSYDFQNFPKTALDLSKGVVFRPQQENCPLLYQVRPGDYWFGVRRLRIGMPPRSTGADFAPIVVPDYARDVFYVFVDGKMNCHALDEPLTKLGSIDLGPVPLDDLTQQHGPYLQLRAGLQITVYPVAITIGNDLFLFGLDRSTGKISRCKLAAFEIPEKIAAAIKQKVETRFKFPEKIPVGVELSLPVFKHEFPGHYKIAYSSTSNMTISDTGVLNWKPAAKDLGKHEFTVTAGTDRRSLMKFYLKTEVVHPARLSVGEGGTGEVPDIVKLPAESPANDFALGEDKTQLAVSHKSSNQISIWDVQSNKLLKTLSCPLPDSMVWRGDKLYVASDGKGTIQVLNTKDWSLAKEVQVGIERIRHLSAPQGKYFKGQILASCLSGNEQVVVWIDVNQGTHEEISRIRSSLTGPLASVEYTGRTFLMQNPSSTVFSYRFKKSASPAKLTKESARVHLPYQARKGTFWFTRNQVARGNPPQPLGAIRGRMVIPDCNRDVFYVFEDETIECIGLDVSLTSYGKRMVNAPRASALFGTSASRIPYRRNDSAYRQLAVTHDGRLTIYVLDRESSSIFTCKMDAFDSQSAEKLTSSFPKHVAVGKQVTFKLMGNDTEGDYSVKKGPDGASVSELGQLTWTPNEDDLGPREIQVTAVIGKIVHELRLTTNVVPEGAADGAGVFDEVRTAEPVSDVAIMEDRRQLILAHESADQLSIWDIGKEQVVHKIETPRPKFVMARGEKIYVASSGKGTVNIFSRADDWKLAKSIKVASNYVYRLSAPQKEFFKGKFLATSSPTLYTRGASLSLVDEATGALTPVTEPRTKLETGVSSYDGTSMLGQDGSYSIIRSFPGNSGTRMSPLRFERAGNLYQVHPSSHWFGANCVLRGYPPKIERDWQRSFGDRMLIPDLERHVFYEIEKGTIKCVALDEVMTDVGSHPAVLPVEPPGNSDPKIRFMPLDRKLAFTRDKTLYVFALASHKSRLFFTKLPAFEINPVVGAAAENACGGKNTLPRAIPTGKPQTVLLLGKPMRGKFDVMTGPDSVSITEDGRLKWTPTESDVGEHRIKIRAEVDGQFAFLGLETNVVLPEDVEQAMKLVPVDDNAGKLPLRDIPNVKLSYGLDGKSILLLQPDSFMVLDRTGMHTLREERLQPANRSFGRPSRSYSIITERDEYYVGLSGQVIELIDKESFKTIKTIGLPRYTALMISHPSKPLSYIAPGQSVENYDPARKRVVYEIDEQKGSSRELPRVFGSVVGIDPQGRYLYTVTKRANQPGRIEPVFASYALEGSQVRPFRVSPSGISTKKIVLAPDGKQVLQIGRDRSGAVAIAYSAGAKEKEQQFATRQVATDLDFHPVLPLVVASIDNKLKFFNRQTGEAIENLVQLPSDTNLDRVSRVMFTPDGKRLMVVITKSIQSTGLLYSLPLKLSQEQRLATVRGYVRPAPQPIEPDIPGEKEFDVAKLEALSTSTRKEMSPKQIARSYSHAVVSISDSGSGVIIGKSGYVLTTSDALPLGAPEITYRHGDETLHAEGKVVESNDRLSLLKFTPEKALTHAFLAQPGTPQPAEDVLVVASPGGPTTLLNHTFTRGYMSNASRRVDDSTYLQTSIGFEKLMQGAPVFDSRGSVIGLVANVNDPKGAANAIIMKDVFAFLGADKPAAQPVENEYRKWVDRSGRFSVEAAIVSFEAGVVKIKRKDGRMLNLPIRLLSEADQQYVKAWAEK